jgi:hypothetical protein
MRGISCWQACFDTLTALHARDLVHGDSGARNFMHSPARRRWVVIDAVTLCPCRGERRPLPSGACRALLARRHDLAQLYRGLLALGGPARSAYRALPDAHRRLEAAGGLAWTGCLLLPCCTCQGFWACDKVCERVPPPPAVFPAEALAPANLRRVLAVVAAVQNPHVAAFQPAGASSGLKPACSGRGPGLLAGAPTASPAEANLAAAAAAAAAVVAVAASAEHSGSPGACPEGSSAAPSALADESDPPENEGGSEAAAGEDGGGVELTAADTVGRECGEAAVAAATTGACL